ncbi:hypothetical protein GE09DRAFT_732275 [Coniochaeta sp. 2T2.1]|nr:hypothetical protein GE09DRAFT_732275 [Coniochaeta sp. 2T2.1]
MPRRTSWVEGSMHPDCDFTVENIPFGIISTCSLPIPHAAVAIGNFACDLEAFSNWPGFYERLFPTLRDDRDVFSKPTLNTFAALGRQVHREVRSKLQDIFTTGHADSLERDADFRAKVLVPLEKVVTYLPMHIGDYTDFYAGIVHAKTVGTMFRGPENALQPNYKHIPVGYHGRASSIVTSGTPIRRPWGQVISDPKAVPKQPRTMPSQKLDYEVELGCFISKTNEMGKPLSIEDAEDHIFGYVLLNDWSARDIQSWEYVPLGPFNGKNFATTISPWVVLHEALEPFMTKGEPNDVELQPYLREKRERNVFDIALQIDTDFQTPDGQQSKSELTRTNAKHLLWSFPQMIAHHTLGGCPLRTGDLLGSGTISSSDGDLGGGSLLELTGIVSAASGKKPRGFLQDGETVVFRGYASSEDNGRVGFGVCTGRVEPALDLRFD